MVRQVLCDGMEAQVLSDPGLRVGVAVLRSPRAGAFEQEDIRFPALLLPHLRRVLRTQMQLATLGVERDCALESLDHLSHGMLIVDAQARVIYANATAEMILRVGDGLGVDIASGRQLRASRPRQTAALRHLIARAAGCDGTAARSKSGGNGSLRLDRAAAELSSAIPQLHCRKPS